MPVLVRLGFSAEEWSGETVLSGMEAPERKTFSIGDLGRIGNGNRDVCAEWSIWREVGRFGLRRDGVGN